MPKNHKREANAYDKILKENFAAMFIPFISRHLGLDVAEAEALDPKLQTTLERETDVLRMVTSSKGDQYILHLEFQTDNDAEMIFRFKEYNAIIQRKYRLPIRHFLIYIGQKPMYMREELPEELVFRAFETLDVQELDFEQVMSSQIPEEILLAILTDTGGNDPEEIVVRVIRRLRQLSENKNTLRRYIAQLQVLSQLRNLDVPTRKILNTMPITLDITKNAFYKDAIEAGLKKGMEQGLKQGLEQGLEQGMEKAFLKQKLQQLKRISTMLEDGLPLETIARYEEMDIADLKSTLEDYDLGRQA